MATTPIKLKRSNTISVIPDTSDLIEGEVALNTVDRKLYVRNDSSTVITLANHYATDFDTNVITFKVTVATKDSSHPYNGTGSNLGYKINGVFSPYLKLIPRNTYRFDQSDSSNSGHPLLLYYDVSKTTQYSTGVTVVNGTGGPGTSGAYTQIVVGDSTPPVLHYQCSAHANMGWALTTSTRNFTGFDTDDLSEGSSNLYHTTARVNTAIDNRVTNTFINNLSGIVADTTTALANARTIGGVSFDGTANIDLPGVNTSGNQDTSGNAATATALETARNIHGVSFDGTGNIDLTEVIQDTVGAMFSGNTETNITATYQDSDGTIDLVASGGGTASDSFKTISVSGQSDVVADSSTDTLTLVAGSNMTITTNASGDEITFVSSGGSGGSGESVSWSVTQSSHGLAVGDVIYNNGTNYVKAQANATGTLGLFIVSAVADTNTFTATFSGKITLSSLTAGQYYFVSTTSAGDFTATEPTSGYSNPILFALSTTEAVVLPYRPQDLPSSGDAAQGRTLLDVFSKSETNSKISAFAIALGG